MTHVLQRIGFKRAMGAALVVALIASVLLIAAKPARTAVRTRVSIHVTDRTVRPNQKINFFGKVKSPRRKCERRRTVVLKRKGTGKVKRDVTDREGEYRIRINPRPNRGRYFVVVKPKRIRVAGYGGYSGYGYDPRFRRCAKARSRTINISPAFR